MKRIIVLLISGIFILNACSENGDQADAYGNFESTDQLVMPEMAGKLLWLHAEEGKSLTKGDTVALVDTTQLHLKKKQVLASIRAVRGKLQDATPQVELYSKQIQVLEKERKRVASLLEADAATQKQLDDLQGKIDVLEQQINTTRDQVSLANRSILSQIPPLESQIEQIEEQIDRSYVINPRNGTVLLKLVEAREIVNPARALYKIADVSSMELRAYISGDQLPKLKIGQNVTVAIDQTKRENQKLEGTVSWIAEQAEFTPKTIQTKEERVNLVYAFKVHVDNDTGVLKIGMPGEVHFHPGEDSSKQESN